MYSKLSIVLFAVVCATAVALPHQDNSDKDIINALNKIDNEPSLPLFGGLRIERVENGRAFGESNSGETFEDRAERYLESHELNLAFPGEDDESEDEFAGRSADEGRTRKVRKVLLPLLLALKLKKAVVFKVLFMIVKFISLKALAISFLALIFAGATFFKDLLAKKKDHVTTAYITGSPLNAEIVHSDWSRNGQATAQDLAYNHYGLTQPY
ncbi:uncharacterized protein LOC129940736 isoform X2 [Eupeodes corollae]|uniref:uncharacterized protein LOC129940736 isoform X2 n=1 Tax=Eupeodes corollae TaxID=290404 RepID=UPI002490DA6B|nr:uncharacterized protein LOC129940736 isoform X2 [Eupeodes corollae]